jgi:hypothetical protein
MIADMCSICAGSKVLLTGEPCGCKDGTAMGEAQFIREEYYEMRAALEYLVHTIEIEPIFYDGKTITDDTYVAMKAARKALGWSEK